MLPVIFSIGSFHLYTLGFLIAIGFLLASFLSWRRLRNLGINEEKAIDLLIAIGFFGFTFSRLLYIIAHFQDFAFFFQRWVLISRYPGLSFWGVIIGGVVALVRFSRKQGLGFWQLADELVFGFLPFLVLAQLGCFFDGCVLGTVTSLPWGMFFPGDFIRRHPVSLMATVVFLLIWVFLLRIERHWRSWKWYQSSEGLVSLLFLFLALSATFTLAFFQEGGLYYLSIKKVVSLTGALAVGGFIFYRSSLRERLTAGIKERSSGPKKSFPKTKKKSKS